MKQSIIGFILIMSFWNAQALRPLGSSVGRFELIPYPVAFKDIEPTSTFDLLERYLIISNKTGKLLTIIFFHKKDTGAQGSIFVPVCPKRAADSLIKPRRVSGFALPEYKWYEKRGTGFGKNKIVDVLLHAPLEGFTVYEKGEEVPQKPEIVMSKKQNAIHSYFYDIVPTENADNERGFEIKQVTGKAR